jgi:hypothetical protein
MAVFMSIPKSKSIGTSIIPPPIPKKPESVPTKIPTATNKISINILQICKIKKDYNMIYQYYKEILKGQEKELLDHRTIYSNSCEN